MTGAVHLEDLWSCLFIDSNEETNARQRPHTGCLSIDLGQIGHSLGKDADGALVAIVVGPVPAFVSGSLHHGFAVGHGSRDTDTGFLGQLEEMGDTFGCHQTVGDLLLSDDTARILPTDSNARQTRIGCFETVFHLVQTPLGGENRNVVVIVSVVCCLWLQWLCVSQTMGKKTEGLAYITHTDKKNNMRTNKNAGGTKKTRAPHCQFTITDVCCSTYESLLMVENQCVYECGCKCEESEVCLCCCLLLCSLLVACCLLVAGFRGDLCPTHLCASAAFALDHVVNPRKTLK